MAIDQKEQDKLDKAAKKSAEELIETQVDMSNKFRKLTSTLAENDASLGQTAASLRKNSKDTFVGMLASQRLAKVTAELANDTGLKRIDLERKREDKNLKGEEDEIKRRTALADKEFKSQEDYIKRWTDLNDGEIKSIQANFDEKENLLNAQVQKQALRGKEEQTNFDNLKRIKDDILKAEAEGHSSVRTLNDEGKVVVQSFVDAKKAQLALETKVDANHASAKQAFADNYEKLEAEKNSALKLTADETKKISEKEIEAKKLHSDEVDKISEKEIEAKKLHSTNIEKLDVRETDTREAHEKRLNDAMVDTSGFTAFSDSLKDLSGGILDFAGWADDATKFVNNIQTVMQGIGNQVAKVSKKLFSMLPDSIQEKLGDAWKFMSGGLKKMGKQFLNMGKQFIKGAARMAMAAATLVAGMLATAASVLISGIVMLAPAILIGLAIAGLIFGIMYLAKKFEENKEMIMFKWGLIQEGFSIAIDGLILWKDKAVNFIGNVFQDIWMSIKSLFSAVLTGIENGINFAIQGINSFLPERFQIDEVDIGAKGMAAGLDEEKAAIAIERDAEAVEFAERKDELDERKATVIENFKLDEVPKDGKPLSLENAKAANAMTGEGIATATTEVKQGEKQGNQVNVVNTSSSPTTVSNTQVHNNSGSPRDTDRTAVGLNAIAV